MLQVRKDVNDGKLPGDGLCFEGGRALALYERVQTCLKNVQARFSEYSQMRMWYPPRYLWDEEPSMADSNRGSSTEMP
jgi:hypothetical protein